MKKLISQTQRSYLAGFLDGDGSIYAQLKPNKTYKYGFQIVYYIVLFQSQKNQNNFAKICAMINLGYLRVRKDGILEYIIGTQEGIKKFIELVEPYSIMKKPQLNILKRIIILKSKVKNQKDFKILARLIDNFRKLNYSKKRKFRTLTP